MPESCGGYRISNPFAMHFVTLTVIDWVDVFTRSAFCDILIENLRFYQAQRALEIYNYTIMSNHIHAILRQPESRWRLQDTLRDFKKMTARQILENIASLGPSRREWIEYRFRWHARHKVNRGLYQVWTDDNHPEEIWSRPFYEQKSNYGDQNAVRAGLVHEPHHWRYSSASDHQSANPLIRLSTWDE